MRRCTAYRFCETGGECREHLGRGKLGDDEIWIEYSREQQPLTGLKAGGNEEQVEEEAHEGIRVENI